MIDTPVPPSPAPSLADLQKEVADLNAKLAAETAHTHPISRLASRIRASMPRIGMPTLTLWGVVKSSWAAWVTLSLASCSAVSLVALPGCPSVTTPDNPLPTTGNRLLVVYDASVPMGQETLSALDSEDVRLLAGANLAVGPEGSVEARVYDNGADVSQDHPIWQDAMNKAKGKQLPFVAITGSKASYAGDLPKGKNDMVALLKKCFGGAKLPPPVRGPPMMVGATGADPFARKNTGYDPSKNLASKGNFATFDIPLMSDADIEAAIVRKNADRSWLNDIRTTGNKGTRIPSRDQDGKGYCWAHSSTWATIILRAKNGQPYADLSAYAVACKIKNFQDEGGWGSESLEFIAKTGVPSSAFWPQQSMLRSNDNANTWADAAKHRVTEWVALDSGPTMARQMATCLCNNIPVVTDLNWWGHSICTVRLKSWGPNGGNLVTTIQNSWGDGWGTFGEGDLQGSKAIPDAAVAPRVTTGSFAMNRQQEQDAAAAMLAEMGGPRPCECHAFSRTAVHDYAKQHPEVLYAQAP